MTTASEVTLDFTLSSGNGHRQIIRIPNGDTGVGIPGEPGDRGADGATFEAEDTRTAHSLNVDNPSSGPFRCGIYSRGVIYCIDELPIKKRAGLYGEGQGFLTIQPRFIACDRAGNLVPSMTMVEGWRGHQEVQTTLRLVTVIAGEVRSVGVVPSSVVLYMRLEEGVPTLVNLYYASETSGLSGKLPLRPAGVVARTPRTIMTHGREGR